MKKQLYKSSVAFFGGLLSAGALFFLFYLLFNIAGIKKPFPPTALGLFLHFLILNALLEETTKFLLIRKGIGKFPFGLSLGFGFGLGETFLRYSISTFGLVPIMRSGAIVLHILTAGIICYFIKKKKPLLGLLIAIILHTAFNLLAGMGD